MIVHHLFTGLITVCILRFNVLPTSYASNMLLRTCNLLSRNLQMPRNKATFAIGSTYIDYHVELRVAATGQEEAAGLSRLSSMQAQAHACEF